MCETAREIPTQLPGLRCRHRRGKLQTVAFTDGGAGYFAGDKIHVGDAVFYVHAVDTDNAITHIRAEDHAVNNTDPNAPNYDANWAPTAINTDLSVDTKGTAVNANKTKMAPQHAQGRRSSRKIYSRWLSRVFDDTGFALGADFSYGDNVVGVLYQAIADDATNVAELYVLLDAHYADQNALDAVFDGNDTDLTLHRFGRTPTIRPQRVRILSNCTPMHSLLPRPPRSTRRVRVR